MPDEMEKSALFASTAFIEPMPVISTIFMSRPRCDQ